MSSQIIDKKLRLALIGPKRVGKDYFRETVFPDYQRAALADILKDLSVEPRYSGVLHHDHEYLRKDFEEVTGHEEIRAKVEECAEKDGVSKDFVISKDALETIDGRRILMNIYKNLPELTTRKYLQNFGDVIKFSESPDYFSKVLLDSIRDNATIVCTDTRFIMEVIDFVIAGFPFVTLNHEYAEQMFVGTEHLQHISEFEMSLSVSKYGHLGKLVDITGHDLDSEFPRLSRDETIEIGTGVRNFVENFQGYPEEVVSKFKKMKIELMSRSGEFGKYGLYEDGYAMEWAKRVSGKDHNEDTMRLCFEKLMEARKIIADIVNQYH